MNRFTRISLLTIAVISSAPVALADVKPAAIFTDNVVLQRDRALPIWGTADAGEAVTVSLLGQQQQATAGQDGKWRVTLQPIPATAEPFEVTIKGNNQVVLRNVLAGDVWICSGQSNMEWSVGASANPQQEIAAANHPMIRLFSMPRKPSGEPLPDVEGATWDVCSPQTINGFSAVGYYFGRHLNQTLDVPIGLIDTSWGGTPAEAWTDMATLAASDVLRPMLDRYEQTKEKLPEAMAKYEAAMVEWEKVAYAQDPGVSDAAKGWADPAFDDSQWQTMTLPTPWERAGINLHGAAWFRKTIDVPAALAGQALTLELGPIDDFDQTFINGQPVGTTGKETKEFWRHPRKYEVPAGVVKAGPNTIAVRVFDRWGDGGMTTGPLVLRPTEGGGEGIKLDGDWRYRFELELPPSATVPPQPSAPAGPNHPNSPANLYNGMIHPIVGFGIKGAIWYQGESNTGRAEQYRELLPAMIGNWRKVWGQGDFPFFVVQLANFLDPPTGPVQESGWPELREAQLMTAQKTPNTGLAVIIDIGDAKDIHPLNKQDVGKRLALSAERIAYGRDVVHSGPTVKDVKTDGNKVTITFDNVGAGLEVREKDGKPLPIGVAGEDRKFVQAEAKVEGNQLVVWSDQVERPVAVRYAWSNNPEGTLLYNKEGLPASPFRTDDFPMQSAGRR